MPHWARLQQVAADWRAAVVVCVGLLLLRSWFFLAWEESNFDSDQAIVGLMAKHLAEGRSWPLYFYGQDYTLAVEAWVAAPFVALFGTSVATLRAVIVALNLATGLILVWRLVRDAGLGVWSAVAASGIFWAAPFITSANLVEATGASIEPFLWVLILWLLRRRPLALGACFAVAVLNREFAIYAAPMLALAYVVEGSRRVRDAALHGTAAAVAFLTVYTGITLLKPFADLLGPGTAGQPVAAASGGVLSAVMDRVYWNPSELGGRFQALVTDYVPMLLGLERFAPTILGIETPLRVGWEIITPVLLVLAALSMLLLVADVPAIVRENRRWVFPVYLIGIGVIAAIAYPVARPLSIFTIRYGLLVLYLPIGLAALMLQPARRRLLRVTAATCMTLLAACAVTDHVRVLVHAPSAPPPAPIRAIVNRLEDRQVRLALGDYWKAYIITFLSDERVKVASTNVERIREVQDARRSPIAGQQSGRHRDGSEGSLSGRRADRRRLSLRAVASVAGGRSER